MNDKNSNMTGIKQIAEKLHLSPGTISIVLNGRGNKMRISRETQNRILATAREMNYFPNINAKRLRNGSDFIPSVALFWPLGSNPVLLERFFTGLQMVPAYQNHEVEISLVPYPNEHISDFLSRVNQDFYSGVIFMGLLEEDISQLKSDLHTDAPVVLFNRLLEKYYSVSVDDFDAGSKVAKLFAARGHQNVAIVAPEKMSRSSMLKFSGFTSACMECGMLMDPSCLIRQKPTYEGGVRAAESILDLPKDHFPTAVFFQESVQAIGALSVLHQHCIRIPEQMEIISYGDNPQDAYTIPSLTSLRMPLEEMSRDCLKIILNHLGFRQADPVKEIYECSFIFRESCRKA